MKNAFVPAVLFLCTFLTAPAVLAQVENPDAKQSAKLFGAWELENFQIVSASGNAVPFCPGAFGKLIYERGGSVSVAINCGANLPREAPAAAFGGMLFYSGNFRIEGNTVFHRITNSSAPQLLGKVSPRTVESLTKDSLVLTGPFGNGSLRVRWHRAPVAPELDPRKEIAVFTYLELKPGSQREFMAAFRKIVQPSLSEPGNIAWFVQYSDQHPTNVVFYTRWINPEALQAHLNSPALVEYIARTAPLLEPGFPKLVRYHPIDRLN